jgi:hypothetical protein
MSARRKSALALLDRVPQPDRSLSVDAGAPGDAPKVPGGDSETTPALTAASWYFWSICVRDLWWFDSGM